MKIKQANAFAGYGPGSADPSVTTAQLGDPPLPATSGYPTSLKLNTSLPDPGMVSYASEAEKRAFWRGFKLAVDGS